MKNEREFFYIFFGKKFFASNKFVISSLFIWAILSVLGRTDLDALFPLFAFGVIIFCLPFIVLLIKSTAEENYKIFIDDLTNLARMIFALERSSIQKKGNLDIILMNTESILVQIHSIYRIKRRWYRFYGNTGDEKLTQISHKLLKKCLQIIYHLKENLNSRLTEQVKEIEISKVEVERNLRWTNALEQVSELQKARLDRQIEQFEELQRVLMKV